MGRLCKTKSWDLAIYRQTTNELPRVCWQRDLNLRTWDNLYRLPMVCESSEKRKGKFKKNLAGIIYIGQHEHIPVNPLRRHDLTGLPNIPRRKGGGQVWLHPLGQSPTLYSHLWLGVGETHLYWGTNDHLPCFLIPQHSTWVSKFAFPA